MSDEDQKRKTPRELFAEKHGEKAARRVDQALMGTLVKAVAQQLHAALASEDMEHGVAFVVICMDSATQAIAYGSNVTKESLAEVLDGLRTQILVDVEQTKANAPATKA